MGTKKNRTARFNIIDLVIVVLILAVIAGVCIRYFSTQDVDEVDNSESATVSFLVQDIRYTSADYFVGGDNVYVDDDGTYLGEFMKGFTITPAEKYITDVNGKTVKVNYPENTRIDVRGQILSEGTWKDGSFMVGGNMYIAAGKKMKICTPHITVTLLVTDVTKNSDT